MTENKALKKKLLEILLLHMFLTRRLLPFKDTGHLTKDSHTLLHGNKIESAFKLFNKYPFYCLFLYLMLRLFLSMVVFVFLPPFQHIFMIKVECQIFTRVNKICETFLVFFCSPVLNFKKISIYEEFQMD